MLLVQHFFWKFIIFCSICPQKLRAILNCHIISVSIPVAQLDRATACGAVGWRFESSQGYTMSSWNKTILTNHVLEKCREKNIEKWELKEAFTKYNLKEKSKVPECDNLIKRWRNREVGVVVKGKEDGNFIIVSAWKRKLY